MKKWKILIVFLIAVVITMPTVVLADWGFGIDQNGGHTSWWLGASSSGGSYGGGWDLSNISMFGLPEGSIVSIISGILFWLLGIFGFIGIIGFVISGIMYLLAAGNDSTVEKAKLAMKWSIVGVVVGLAGLVIIQAINYMLMGSTTF